MTAIIEKVEEKASVLPASITIQNRTITLSHSEIELLKRTICKGADNDELGLFLNVAQRCGFDPFTRQIHAVKRYDSDAGREVMTIQTGIDGFRLVAERTGELNGTDGPYWCGADGLWKDVWLTSEPPVAAKYIVYRKGQDHAYTGIARYEAFVQRRKDGAPNRFWKTMADHMLAKVAEAHALRKAFPADLSGIYTDDEMGQADNGSRKEKVAVKTASSGEGATTAEKGIALLREKLIQVIKQTVKTNDVAEARKYLKELTGVEHEVDLREEEVRELGRALGEVKRGVAKVAGGDIVECDEEGNPVGKTIWKKKDKFGREIKKTIDAPPKTTPAAEEPKKPKAVEKKPDPAPEPAKADEKQAPEEENLF
jgi:phage recombination protein Bet